MKPKLNKGSLKPTWTNLGPKLNRNSMPWESTKKTQSSKYQLWRSKPNARWWWQWGKGEVEWKQQFFNRGIGRQMKAWEWGRWSRMKAEGRQTVPWTGCYRNGRRSWRSSRFWWDNSHQSRGSMWRDAWWDGVWRREPPPEEQRTAKPYRWETYQQALSPYLSDHHFLSFMVRHTPHCGNLVWSSHIGFPWPWKVLLWIMKMIW